MMFPTRSRRRGSGTSCTILDPPGAGTAHDACIEGLVGGALRTKGEKIECAILPSNLDIACRLAFSISSLMLCVVPLRWEFRCCLVQSTGRKVRMRFLAAITPVAFDLCPLARPPSDDFSPSKEQQLVRYSPPLLGRVYIRARPLSLR